MSTFGDRIWAIRRAQGLSQKQFGALIGIGENVVFRWERNLAHPYFASIERITDACGVTIQWFVAGRGEGPEIDPNTPLRRAIRRGWL